MAGATLSLGRGNAPKARYTPHGDGAVGWRGSHAAVVSLYFCVRSCPARPELVAALAAPIIIPDVMELATLADVRILVEKQLPAEYRSKFSWRQLAGLLRRAAEGQQDVAEVSRALRIVLQLEGVSCWHEKGRPRAPEVIGASSGAQTIARGRAITPARCMPRKRAARAALSSVGSRPSEHPTRSEDAYMLAR
jgi:hypothetical protein